jgi:nitric oxide dioxygenase
MIQMLDTALNMLGPDIEMLTEIMAELGQKHVRYGVKADMFPIMGECLVETLRETLKKGVFSEKVEKAWLETYAELSGDMIRQQVVGAP